MFEKVQDGPVPDTSLLVVSRVITLAIYPFRRPLMLVVAGRAHLVVWIWDYIPMDTPSEEIPFSPLIRYNGIRHPFTNREAHDRHHWKNWNSAFCRLHNRKDIASLC